MEVDKHGQSEDFKGYVETFAPCGLRHSCICLLVDVWHLLESAFVRENHEGKTQKHPSFSVVLREGSKA
jgi:hypothetical protein